MYIGMVDIYISYSRKDIEIMYQVRDSLEGAGISVWTDEALKPGTINWQNEIERVIKEVQAVVVILSPEAKNSEWLNRELSFSSMVGLPIYPVLARGDEKEAVPLQLVTTQIIDIRDDVPQGTGQLVKELKRLGLSPKPTKKAQTNKASTLSKRAEEHFFAQRYKEAIADAREALEIDPDNTEALNVKADAHKKLKEWDEAIEDATRSIEQKKRKNQYALQIRAETYLSVNEGEKAIEDATRVLKSDPENTEVLQIRADAYLMEEKLEQAVKDANKILEIESWNAYALRNRAEAYLLMGETEKALEDATQAIEIDPENEAAKRIERLARSDRFNHKAD
jgi:tetratricopeptide (TPR) repeat protein